MRMITIAATAALLAGTSAFAQTTTGSGSTVSPSAGTSVGPDAAQPAPTDAPMPADAPNEMSSPGPQGGNAASDGAMRTSPTEGATSGESMSTTTTTSSTTGSMGSGSMGGGSIAAGSMAGGSFATYDANRDGGLTPLEFASWWASSQPTASGGATPAKAMSERRSRKSNNAATDLLNVTATEFSRMDANRDFRVTEQELAMASSGGMAMSQPGMAQPGMAQPAPMTDPAMAQPEPR